ncbi:MAG TPA: glycoside hydrolase family 3 N-terminal domain-containing protein [Terriglobales bacterium]
MLKKLALVTALLVLLASGAMAKDRKARFSAFGPVQLDHDGDKWAQKTLKKLTLEEKIGQMLLVWARAEFLNLDSPEYTRLHQMIRQYHIGSFGLTVPVDGPFVLRNQPYEAAMITNQLQLASDLPLLIGADFERGLSMRLYGTTVFPHSMAFGADGNPADAESSGRITGVEARAIGVHWNFFPDADVNSNPANPVINTRSYGEDPRQVGELAAAYIKGAHEAGMLVTAKHFPGHGDTSTNSHLSLAEVNGDMQRLQSVELPPFQAAINAGVDSVMIAHVTVPALESDPNKVATTSHAVVTGLLKTKMGFQGLVVTDALDMNALMRIYSSSPNPSGAAAVAAVKAGNDMVLIPLDIDGAYNGLLQAVRSGEIPESQIDESVLKVLRAKASVGLHKARLVDLDKVSELVALPGNLAFGQRVADAAVTLVRDNRKLLPLKRQNAGTAAILNPYLKVEETRNRVVAVIVTDDLRFEYGRVFERELRARVPDARVFYVDHRIAAGLTPPIVAAVEEAQVVLAPVFLGPMVSNEMKNSLGLPRDMNALIEAILQRAPERTAIIAMGNPYLAAEFPMVQNYLCTYSFTTVSELSAIRALFGEIAIRGRLPVTIPGVAQRGEGIDRPQQAGRGGTKFNVTTKTVSAP